MIQKFEKCANPECPNTAQWIYMPGFGDGSSPYVCDDCVHRGCSCNARSVNEEYRDLPGENEIEGVDWEWLKVNDERASFIIKNEKEYWWHLDNGRPYPCCEYEWSENGFVTEEYEKYLEIKCKEIGYDILSDDVVKSQNWFIETGEYFWSDELIEKIEKIIEQHNTNEK